MVCSLFQAFRIPVTKLQLDFILSDDAFSTVLAVQIDWLRILRLRSTIGREVIRWFRFFPAGRCPARYHGAENRQRSDNHACHKINKRPIKEGGIVVYSTFSYRDRVELTERGNSKGRWALTGRIEVQVLLCHLPHN